MASWFHIYESSSSLTLIASSWLATALSYPEEDAIGPACLFSSQSRTLPPCGQRYELPASDGVSPLTETQDYTTINWLLLLVIIIIVIIITKSDSKGSLADRKHAIIYIIIVPITKMYSLKSLNSLNHSCHRSIMLYVHVWSIPMEYKDCMW